MASGCHFLTCVHASVLSSKRRVLWHELINLSSICNDNWYMIEDLNAFFGSHEKRGGRVPSLRSCSDFSSAMANCHLTCLDIRGSYFTWTNNRAGQHRIYIRLDRALYNNNALIFWRFIDYFTLVRHSSNHHPILLSCYQMKSFSLQVVSVLFYVG